MRGEDCSVQLVRGYDRGDMIGVCDKDVSRMPCLGT